AASNGSASARAAPPGSDQPSTSTASKRQAAERHQYMIPSVQPPSAGTRSRYPSRLSRAASSSGSVTSGPAHSSVAVVSTFAVIHTFQLLIEANHQDSR